MAEGSHCWEVVGGGGLTPVSAAGRSGERVSIEEASLTTGWIPLRAPTASETFSS